MIEKFNGDIQTEVAISMIFRRSRGRLRPKCSHMAAHPKLNRSSSTPTAAAATAEKI